MELDWRCPIIYSSVHVQLNCDRIIIDMIETMIYVTLVVYIKLLLLLYECIL